MVKHTMAVTLALAAASMVYGQPKKQTLGDLWPQVEQNYPGIGAKQLAVAAAEWDERAVKSKGLPQVNAQAQNSYSTYNGTQGAFFPQAGLFNVNGAAAAQGTAFTPNTFGSATVEWEIFSFGKLRKANEAAHAATGKKSSEKEAYLVSLKKEFAGRYIHLLYSEELLNWNSRNVDRLRDVRGVTTGLAAAGLRPGADSLLALSAYTQALGENDRLLGNREASLFRVSELYGAEQIDYRASLERFSVTHTADAGRDKQIDAAHPVLASLHSQSQYYAVSSEVQQRSALPSVHLLGGYTYRGSGIHPDGRVSASWRDGFSNAAGNAIAGIGLTWDITGVRTKHLKAASLRKEAESTRLQYAEHAQAMQAGLAAAQAKMQRQSEQLKKTTRAVEQAREAYDSYLARYKSGLITLSELLQIQLLLDQAGHNHIEAARAYWLLVADEAALTADFDFLFNHL